MPGHQSAEANNVITSYSIHYTKLYDQRGIARQDTFLDDNDCSCYAALLKEGVERFGCRVHAFCLMPDHVHLVVQVGELPLSRLMQNLGYRYSYNFV